MKIIMKKLKLVLLLLPVLALAGCVKQKNCDCNVEGTFIYDPITKTGEFYERGKLSYYIEGHIPKKFQSTTAMAIFTYCKLIL